MGTLANVGLTTDVHRGSIATPISKSRSRSGIPLRRATRVYSPFVGMTPGERAVLLCSIAFLAMFVGALNLTQGRLDLSFIFLTLLVYLVVLVLPLVRYQQEWGWFHPVVFMPLWALVTSVPTSLGVFIRGLERHSALPGRSVQELNGLVAEGLLLSALGWAAFYVGYAFPGQKRTITMRFPEPRAVLPKILLVAGVATAGFFFLIQVAGGIGPLLLQRGIQANQRIQAQIGGHWLVLVGLLPTACLVWIALQPVVVRRPIFWAVFSGGLFMDFAVTGSRSGVIIPIVMAVAIWALRSARIPYFRVLVLGGVALVLLGILGEFRRETFQAETLQDVRLETSITSGFQRGLEERTNRGEDAGLHAVLGRVPEEVDLLWGKSYLSIPAAPVPSALWSEKPEAGSRLTGHLIFRRPEGSGGVPPGAVGEAYWNFHILGVILVMFLWGVAANWFARFYRESRSEYGISALYLVTLFLLSPSTDSFYVWVQHFVLAAIILVMFCGIPRVKGAN